MTTSATPSQPSKQPLLVAVVLTFNSSDTIIASLQSLFDCAYQGLQIRVIDNASSDGTVGLLRLTFPDLHITVCNDNIGFAAGCNIGIQAALDDGADYVFLLNPDAIVAPTMLGTLVDFMEAHPKSGAVGPRTFSTTPTDCGRERLLYAGSFLGLLPLKQSVPGIGEVDDALSCAPPLQVDCIWGHGILLRATTCRAVGLFDPTFFMYYEDLDLCKRMKSAGFELWCEPAALMWHECLDGARAIHSEAWRWRHKAHAMRIFHHKHYGAIVGRGMSLLTSLLEAAQLFRQGHLRALRHQLVANTAEALGPTRKQTKALSSVGSPGKSGQCGK
ncbi:MAG: glycosyltransferase family 2 protein [bacterium]|nr:glycosyltransferase family 2 protein [bacterium]